MTTDVWDEVKSLKEELHKELDALFIHSPWLEKDCETRAEKIHEIYAKYPVIRDILLKSDPADPTSIYRTQLMLVKQYKLGLVYEAIEKATGKKSPEMDQSDLKAGIYGMNDGGFDGD